MSLFSYAEKQVDPFAPYDAKTPPKAIWAYIRSHLAPFRKVIGMILVVGFISAVTETFVIFYSGRLIDLMSETGPKALLSQYGFELMGAAILVLLLRPISVFVNYTLMFNGFSVNMVGQARWRAHRHMLGQSMSFFQNDFAGRLSNRVMNMGYAVEDTVFLVLEGFWHSAIFVIGMGIMLSQMDPILVVPLVIWVVGYIWFVTWIAPRIGKASEKLSAANSALTARVVDAYTNIETVKLFSHAEREESFARTAVARHRLRFARIMRLFSTMIGGVAVCNAFAIVLLISPAVWLWTQGSLSIGEVTAAIAMTIRLNSMSGWIMFLTTKVFEHLGVIQEGLESISVPHDVVDKPGAPELNVSKAELRFEGLTHHYGRDTGGLDGIDLVIPSGQKVGLIGRSGAGKSSLVNLLLRFRDAEGGRVLIDGQDVSQVTQDSLRVTQDSLRAAIGMVTQDSSLLHRSVRQNIMYGRPDASEAQMIEAARRAEAHEFIGDLVDPKGRQGYNAQVGERGVKLSGGQRQRVALARVILKDAPVLILDEATSALDSEVEAAIQETLYGVMQGKTVIAIAHRLSTIAQMDRIIVLDAGRVVEDGTHTELLAKDGLYSSFWKRQSGGFLGAAK